MYYLHGTARRVSSHLEHIYKLTSCHKISCKKAFAFSRTILSCPNQSSRLVEDRVSAHRSLICWQKCIPSRQLSSRRTLGVESGSQANSPDVTAEQNGLKWLKEKPADDRRASLQLGWSKRFPSQYGYGLQDDGATITTELIDLSIDAGNDVDQFQDNTAQPLDLNKAEEDWKLSIETSPQAIADSKAARRKLDLSYHDVRRSETAIITSERIALPLKTPSEFRGNAGLRSIVRQYMLQIEPLLDTDLGNRDQNNELDRLLRKVFTAQVLHFLQKRGYEVEDVATWSWILGATTSELSVKRYVLIARQRRRQNQNMPPQFITLQILRSAFIDRHSLGLLIQDVESAAKCDNQWNSDSGAVLLIRLLRYARSTDASYYERIAELAPLVLPFDGKGNVFDTVQRLTHFYNRFLTLLALPLAQNPFLSIGFQQRAQLMIARSMMKSKLQIPLNREGYRALARVQLLHQKTVDEQQWSSVKSPSWPPWRRDRLGIDEKMEYKGKYSRAHKVIQRLLESGYGPESIEQEARILAGWDTDKSPTIQVRRLTSRRPLSWIKSIFRDTQGHQPEVDHNVWAARVAATRSVREAWLCFYSYMEATANQKRQLRVYHEMFHRLFARTQDTDQTIQPVPGDGKEVFRDPVSARDLVYVPKEPPSVEELYAQMLQDGIRPSGRLLASLIDSAHTLKHGLDMINDSALGDVKKDVLLHPEKYPGYVIRNIFATLPDYLLASYVGLLAQSLKSENVQLFWPSSASTEERGTLPLTPVKPLLYSATMLQIWKPPYMPAYYAVLEGMCIQAKIRHVETNTTAARGYSYPELWRLAKHILTLLEEQRLQVDLSCYRKIVVLIRNIMIRAPAQFRSEQFDDAVAVVKNIFVKSIGGCLEGDELQLPGKTLGTGRQPYWKDVEALILMLGFGRDFSSVVQVLRWLHREQQYLECVDDGGYKMQRLFCAARVALEGTWAQGKPTRADDELTQQARRIIENWDWPEDVDVSEFLEKQRTWVKGMRAAAKFPLE